MIKPIFDLFWWNQADGTSQFLCLLGIFFTSQISFYGFLLKPIPALKICSKILSVRTAFSILVSLPNLTRGILLQVKITSLVFYYNIFPSFCEYFFHNAWENVMSYLFVASCSFTGYNHLDFRFADSCVPVFMHLFFIYLYLYKSGFF